MRTDDDEAPPVEYRAPDTFPGLNAINLSDVCIVAAGDREAWYVRTGPEMLRALTPREVTTLRERWHSSMNQDHFVPPMAFRNVEAARTHVPQPERDRTPVPIRSEMENPPATEEPVPSVPSVPPSGFVTYNRRHYPIPGTPITRPNRSDWDRVVRESREAPAVIYDETMPERSGDGARMSQWQAIMSGTPPPPPTGSTGLDTSRQSDTERVARERREVQRAMAEARESEETPQDENRRPDTLIMTPARQAPDSLMAMLSLSTGTRPTSPPPTALSTPLRDRSPPGAPRIVRRRLPNTATWGDPPRTPRTQIVDRRLEAGMPVAARLANQAARQEAEAQIWRQPPGTDGPRERPYTPGDRARVQEYTVLAVGVARAPTRLTQEARQVTIDNRRKRLKAPVKQFMTLTDEFQDKIPENTYLQMANACKKIYEVIEELDPTSVEGYQASADDAAFETQEQRIVALEEELRVRDSVIDECQETIRTKTRELKQLNSQMASVLTNEKAACEQNIAYRGVVKALEDHTVIGPRVAFSKVMVSIAKGSDLKKYKDSNLPRKWHALRSGKWNRRSFVIETIKYDKNDYTEGFGALGFSLDNTDKLWEMWAPDACP